MKLAGRISGPLILSFPLIILLVSSGCFGVFGTYIEQGGITEHVETLDGTYLLEGTTKDYGYLLFTPDGRWQFIDEGDIVYVGQYIVINDRAYITTGNQALDVDSAEEYFILKEGGDALVDSDGFEWRKDEISSHVPETTAPYQTPVEIGTPVATSSPVDNATTRNLPRTPDPILEYPKELESVVFTLIAEPNIPAEKLNIGVKIDSRRSGDEQMERDQKDVPLQRIRITFFAYNIQDTEEEFMPRTFAEIYYSDIPYVTKHHTINPDVIESKGVDLPIDSARGFLNVRKPYNYGAIIEIVENNPE